MKSYKDFKSQINEVLKSNDPIEKWIDDFVHSKNPKFAGKTKAERIDMAKGAYYGAQKNEGYAASQNSTAVQDMEAVEYKGIGTDVVDKKKKLNPQPNLTTAKKQVKDFKEEAYCESCDCAKSKCKCHELDEKRGLWDNIHAKRKRIASGSGERMRKPGSKGAPSNQDLKNSQKEVKESFDYNFDVLEEAVKSIDQGEYDYEGQMSRTQLQTTMRNCQDLIGMIKNNDNMPEWVQSKITLAQDYISTVRDYLQSKEELDEGKVYDPFTKKMVPTKPIKVQAGGGATRNGVPVETGPSKYKEKLNKEEVQIDELSKGLVARYSNKVAKTTQANYDKSKDKFQFSSGRQDGMKNAVKRLTKEYSEQIDEISKKTLANYVNKASHDAASGAYQGKEYTAQSLQHTAAGDWDASKKKHDMATKEFNRANKRLANIPKATTKMAKEEVQIDELSKNTLNSYIDKAKHHADWAHTMKFMDHKQATDIIKKREAGIGHAINKKANKEYTKEGFLNKSEEDDMQTLSAAEFYKKYGKNKTSHRQGRGTKSSDVEKYTEQVEESRGHKILNTFFKNREIAQRAFNGQNKPEEKKPEEKNTETPKPSIKEDDKVYDEKWKTFNSKNKKGEK
jgi:hypothetical protein